LRLAKRLRSTAFQQTGSRIECYGISVKFEHRISIPRVGSSNFSERAKQNQSLRSRLEGLCFPENRIWEAAGKLWRVAWLIGAIAALAALLIFGATQNAIP
jgi:hypothetical protein